MNDLEFILNKARQYCSFQERCIFDMTMKLQEWKVSPGKIEKIIESLLKDEYLNEERYARLFAGGKFRQNKWGKNKIIHEMEKKKIPELYIQIGLEEIDEKEYFDALKEMLSKKSRQIPDANPEKRKQKLISFGLQKGYHYGMIIQALP